jgi:GT2 family glycosyltransferase
MAALTPSGSRDAADVTVVMITRDRRDRAVSSVRRLLELPERPAVIVVDNGSSDGTAKALSAVPGVRVVAVGRNLAAAGRNVGVRLAATECVAFADDDSWWAPGSLQRASELFAAHPRLAVLTGRTLVGPEQRNDPINAELAAAPFGRDTDLPGPTTLGFLACAAIVRRTAFLGAGGFHRRYGVGGEEQLLALDLAGRGYGVAYVPELLAYHHPAPGPERAGRRARQLRNDLWTVWLRRSWPAVVRRTAAVVHAAGRDPEARSALRAAAAGLPWVLRERRPLPGGIERMLT